MKTNETIQETSNSRLYWEPIDDCAKEQEAVVLYVRKITFNHKAGDFSLTCTYYHDVIIATYLKKYELECKHFQEEDIPGFDKKNNCFYFREGWYQLGKDLYDEASPVSGEILGYMSLPDDTAKPFLVKVESVA